MIKKISALLLVIGIMLGGGIMLPVAAHAASPLAAQCADDPTSTVCQENTTPNTLIKKIINALLFIVGAISVIMLIVGGLFYATSAGDSGRVTTAKNIIFGAVIGLVVSILAYAIVQFVFTRFK